jgi:hypothetical protein
MIPPASCQEGAADGDFQLRSARGEGDDVASVVVLVSVEVEPLVPDAIPEFDEFALPLLLVPYRLVVPFRIEFELELLVELFIDPEVLSLRDELMPVVPWPWLGVPVVPEPPEVWA